MMRVTTIGDEGAIHRAVDERLRAVAACCEAEGQPVLACQILDAVDRGDMPLSWALRISQASTLQPKYEVDDCPTGWLVHFRDGEGRSLGAWTWSEHDGHLWQDPSPDGAT